MLDAYRHQTLSSGWTRVETLIQLYDRAIAATQGCKDAEANKDVASYAQQLVVLHKALVALHAGLKPEEDEVAFNVARLLHFVTVLLQERKWDYAIRILNQLRESFTTICDEANELERSGVIPPMPMGDSYESLA